jgi:hypothetical protein
MWLWVRLIIGALLLIAGVIWLGQGLNLIKGSFMTGDPTYAVIGAIVALGGLWLLWAPARALVRR